MAFERITIKYGGNYHEWGNDQQPLTDLDIPLAANGALEEGIDDESVKTAVMVALDAPNLEGYVVDPPQDERDRGEHGEKTVLNLRPTATYGLHGE